jgi:sialate O-acetylesterase
MDGASRVQGRSGIHCARRFSIDALAALRWTGRMNSRRFLTHSIVLTCLATAALARGEVRVAPLFSDSMVLQQDVPAPIWGWADDGEVVTVQFRGRRTSATARNNKWSLKLPKLRAGGPDALTISTRTKTLQFSNVLVGEVWICSGQSNMEWPLDRAFEPEADIASATNSLLRFFKVPNVKADCPTTQINASWETCSPLSAKGFSAVGYYFGRDLQKARKVPVGLIQSDWGGSPAEVWMSREALEINPRYRTEILDAYLAAEKNYRAAMATYEKEKAEAQQKGEEFKKRAPALGWKPTELYNGMIAPLIPYAFKGVIWYQGESNASRAQQYRTLFADMIRNWRRDWEQGDFPFLEVQLAPFQQIKPEPADSAWAELREAQILATKTLPNVGMAVITDVGEEKDIHPQKKQPVGARLALAARAIAYGEHIEYSGPSYHSMGIADDKAVVRFEHVGKGLEARGGQLKGFAVCGEDSKFVWADAEIEGDSVIVSSLQVAKPVAVRYGWADFPVVNLWNKDGLPASPFRTDDFPLTTEAKKDR